jgi:hypothetical protein
VVPIVLGALTYLYWRRNTSWRDSAPPAPDWLTPALADIEATEATEATLATPTRA